MWDFAAERSVVQAMELEAGGHPRQGLPCTHGQGTGGVCWVWRGGDEAGTVEQGIKILGTLLGHPDLVQNQLQHVREHHQKLWDRVPLVPDVQGYGGDERTR